MFFYARTSEDGVTEDIDHLVQNKIMVLFTTTQNTNNATFRVGQTLGQIYDAIMTDKIIHSHFLDCLITA